MDVLNFAHGAFVAIGGYVGWTVADHLVRHPRPARLAARGHRRGRRHRRRDRARRHQAPVSTAAGPGARHGRSRAVVPALLQAIWGADARTWLLPGLADRDRERRRRAGADVVRFLLIGCRRSRCSVGLQLLLSRTRAGLIVRAGVEDREMVTTLGIDVRRCPTRGVRSRRRGRRVRRRAVRGVTRLGLARRRHLAADLRVRGRGARRHRIDHRHRVRRRRRRSGPAVRRLLLGQPRRGVGGDPARRGAAAAPPEPAGRPA